MDESLSDYLAGRPGAAEAFVARWRALGLSVLSRVLHTASREHLAMDEEDLLQEVFLRLFQDGGRLLRTYDPSRASFATWFAIVARSVAISILRRKHLATEAFDPERHAAVVEPKEDPLSSEIPPEILTPRQALVLHLLFDQEMSVEEAAKVLGVDIQTIRSTKHKAIERLRKHFHVRKEG